MTVVRSGRCVPPVYGSLRIQTSPGCGSWAITAATASGIAPRWTGMCSACATIRPCSSNSAVEQSCRSLMFAENAPRISTAPISSAIETSWAPITCSSTGIMRPVRAVAFRWRRSRPPSPTAPSTTRPRARPAGARGRRARGPLQLERRARSRLGGPHGDELDLQGAVRVAVARLVRSVKALGQRRPERDGELERLPGVAQVGLAFVRQLAGRLERGDDAAHGVSPLVAGGEAQRAEHAGGRRDEHRAHAELVSQRACVQRARPAEGDEGEVARVVTLLHRHDAQRAEHLRVDHRHDRAGVDVAERPRRRVGVELDPPGKRCGQAPEEQVRVGHGGTLAAAPVAGRARAGPPRSRARRGARRPRRATRAIRRPLRRCGSPASAAGSGSRRPRAGSRASPRRRRSRRRRWRCRPCRTRSRRRSRRVSRRTPHRLRRRQGPTAAPRQRARRPRAG